MIYKLRLLISIWLLGKAFDVTPEEYDRKVELASFLINYLEDD